VVANFLEICVTLQVELKQCAVKGVRQTTEVQSTVFLFAASSRPTLRSTQPLLQLAPEAIFPGVKVPVRVAHYSLHLRC
jgi:hypothetical protein